MVLEKTLESPLNRKEIKSVNPKGNQPWVFIERTDAEAEVTILRPPDVKIDSLEKTLMLGKTEGRRRRGWQRMRWLDGIIHLTDRNVSKLWDIVKAREAWPAAVHGVEKSWTQLSDWKTTGWRNIMTEEKSWFMKRSIRSWCFWRIKWDLRMERDEALWEKTWTRSKMDVMGIPDHLTCLLKSVCRSRSNSYNCTRNNRLIPDWERSTSRLYIVTLLI